MSEQRVLLTGASGSMGHEAFLELRRRQPRYDVKLLLRPSKVNKKMFAPYAGESGLEIIWGDLTKPDDVARAVEGVDAVLHPAAMISPAADRNPKLAHATNVGAMRNIIDAIRKQPGGEDNIRLVAVGSVAQYGDRLPPIEMIKVGDPLKPSVHDYYALTKSEAEMTMMESGLRHWASMRQTFICIPNLLSLLDPILFHQPIEQRIEFITSRDAGYGLVQCLEVGDDFWGRIYNMAGGPTCRVRFIDFAARIFSIFGIKDYRKVFDRNWFALKNFHCGYYEDSWVLNEHLGHWRDSYDDYCELVEQSAAWWMKAGGRIAPAPVIKMLARRMAEPMDWIEQNNEPYIKAFFGSREAWEKIPDWDRGGAGNQGEIVASDDAAKAPTSAPANPDEIGLEAMHAFARSRGGACLDSEFSGKSTRHRWRCGRNHEFEASPVALMHGGYWCPRCFPNSEDTSGWDYADIARTDPLLQRFYLG